MRHQSHNDGIRVPIDAGRQVAQLRHVLRLVEELSGVCAEPAAGDAALDEAARISSLYQQVEPVVQRRFDTLAAAIASWSTAGVEALLAAGDERSPGAIRRLADELRAGLEELSALLQPAEAPEPVGLGDRGAIPSP